MAVGKPFSFQVASQDFAKAGKSRQGERHDWQSSFEEIVKTVESCRKWLQDLRRFVIGVHKCYNLFLEYFVYGQY